MSSPYFSHSTLLLSWFSWFSWFHIFPFYLKNVIAINYIGGFLVVLSIGKYFYFNVLDCWTIKIHFRPDGKDWTLPRDLELWAECHVSIGLWVGFFGGSEYAKGRKNVAGHFVAREHMVARTAGWWHNAPLFSWVQGQATFSGFPRI